MKFAGEHPAPLRLLRDVKVVQFGTPSTAHTTENKLVMMNYRARWTDGPSKVIFESRIEEDEEGRPSYNVYVIDTTDEGKKLRYPVGKGASPDDIWTKVEERQKHALMKEKGLMTPESPHAQDTSAKSPPSPTPGSPSKEGKLSTVDVILKKVSSLSGVWGLEKYGFIDLTCLKAMEGQEGVSETTYKYVNERAGWVQEQMNLRSLLAERGQRLRGGMASKPGKDGQIERVVERVMDNMLRKVLTWNEKYESKLEKQKERERLKLERQKDREQRQREKRLAREALNAGLPDDLSLEGAADVAPPEPVPISSLISGGECVQSDVEHVVEMWCLAYRFGKMLGMNMKKMPTVEGMLKTYCQGEGACGIFVGMVDFLLSELCDDIVQQVTSGDAHLRRVDFIPPTRNARMLAATEDSWPNVLHRYLYSVAVAAARWAQTTGKKEELNFINYPLDHVHPYDVMDKITSGPTMLELATGEMSLMLTDQSEQRIQARRDALSLRAAGLINGTVHETSIAKNDKMLRAVLAKLYEPPVDLVPGGGLSIVDISFMSPESALETRLGYPMDMAHVVSRVECLVYQMEEDCFRSFASDVFFACKMLDLACQRDTSNRLGTSKQVAKRQTLSRWVIKVLKELSDVHEASGVDGVLEAVAVQTTDGQAIEGTASPRNAAPLPGSCFVCWQKESQEDRDQGNVLEACGSCGMVAHAFCLIREWNLVSMEKEEDGAKCLMCCSSSVADMTSGAATAQLEAKQCTFPEGGYATLWRLVRSLYAVDFNDWRKEEKFELIRLVTLLVSESPAVRDLLEEDAERQRAAKTKLASCRAEIKQLQQEIKKATATATGSAGASENDKGDNKSSGGENGGVSIAPMPATGQQSRIIREAESKRDKLVLTVSKLEEELKNFPPNRKQLLGYDRHWNKYWSLPSGSLDRPEPFIMVERDCASADGVKAPQIAFYRGMDALNGLIDFVNPKGARESVLRDRLTKLRDSFDGSSSGAQAMDCDGDNGDNVANGADVDGDMETSNRGKESSLERFKEALLEYGHGLPAAVFHEVRGTKANRDSWASRTASMTNSYQGIALLVALERMLDPTSFKVHWRNWAIPAPDASTATKSMAACFMRLENLKKAVKLSSNQAFSLSMLDVEDLDADAGTPDEDQDSELARNLDAELNRRRESKSRRTWEVTSPRNRRGVSVMSYKEASDEEVDEEPSASASSGDEMTE